MERNDAAIAGSDPVFSSVTTTGASITLAQSGGASGLSVVLGGFGLLVLGVVLFSLASLSRDVRRARHHARHRGRTSSDAMTPMFFIDSGNPANHRSHHTHDPGLGQGLMDPAHGDASMSSGGTEGMDASGGGDGGGGDGGGGGGGGD